MKRSQQESCDLLAALVRIMDAAFCGSWGLLTELYGHPENNEFQ